MTALVVLVQSLSHGRNADPSPPARHPVYQDSMKFISLKYHFQLRDNAAHVHTHKSAESIRVRYVVNLNA